MLDGCRIGQQSRRSLDRLIRAGLSPRRARRVLREFSDHHADLVAEQLAQGARHAAAECAAGARLGTEEQLVANLLECGDLRSWARRCPAIAFALAPVLILAAAFVASLLLLIALVEWLKARGDPLISGSALMHWISVYGAAYLLWGLPLAAAIMLGAVAAQRRETSIWPGIGIVLTSFVSALTNFSVDLTPLAQASSMTAGIGFNTDHIGALLLRVVGTATPALLLHIHVRHFSNDSA